MWTGCDRSAIYLSKQPLMVMALSMAGTNDAGYDTENIHHKNPISMKRNYDENYYE
ncbi:hypothetical protein DOY81_001607, partial [Sarcophaga bullata]